MVVGKNTSSSSIYLNWTTIPPEYHQGTLLGYRIYYRPADTSRKEQMIEESDPGILHSNLTNLFLWWWYEIRIAGYTKIGSGVSLNVSVQTDEDRKLQSLISIYVSNVRNKYITQSVY